MTFSSSSLIKQHDITDCGAACLASVSAHYKRYLPIARIRQYASTDKRGSNVLGLVEAADKMGFQAKGVKATKESLFKVPKPTIAHVIYGEQKLQHYVVIYEVSEKQVRYMDPADSKMHKESHEDFAKIWTGVLLLLLPKEEFEQGNEKVSVYARFWFLLRPHRSVLMQALVGAIFYTILGLATSIYVQKLVDYVIPDANRNLMNLMSVVMIDLFSGSVIENIAIGDFEPDMQRTIQICQLTGIMELIEQLPNGFETKIGERGANLSGGQQQRIAIARALYKKPEILILDEATSSLDSISEKYIQNTIKQLRRQEKTIILIAHRLSTVKNADKIIVLEKGRLAEEGTHQELLSREGKYYHLWQEQFAPVADLIENEKLLMTN